MRDTALLHYGHEVADRDGDAINGVRMAELCGNDWGLTRPSGPRKPFVHASFISRPARAP